MPNKIKILPPNLINQIAAGEVIERPASIIKELVENSIDAGAKNIIITLNNGGKTLISVQDDGKGMHRDDLELCLRPHSTSKLIEDNLHNIQTLGFRGEALASITSISKISVSSKYKTEEDGYEIYAENGLISPIKPSSIAKGTLIKITDLFFSVPARLKFLRSDQVETNYCYGIIKKLALAHPKIAFKVENNGKLAFNYTTITSNHFFETLSHRVSQIFDKNFLENSIVINEENPKLKIYGLISLPTFHKNHQNEQFFIVNQRSLKDKFLSTMAKIAYGDMLTYGKNPSYVLFLEIDPEEIDVNVNPTKSEIRFKDITFVRHILLSILKNNLALSDSQQNSSTIAESLLVKSTNNFNYNSSPYKQSTFSLRESTKDLGDYFNSMHNQPTPIIQNTTQQPDIITPENPKENKDYPLGFAKAQFHKNWILAQNDEGLIVVDQHAAHERITHEELKTQFHNNQIIRQILLISEIIELDAMAMNILEIHKEDIERLGLIFDFFGKDVILVKEIPAILGNPNLKILITELIEDLKELESPKSFHKKINDILARIACHGSIRSGKELDITEMNALLRKMEETTNYAQCSHGRPTFIKLTLKDLERFFGR